jgi:DNA-binding PadR family transcriptional regulator
MDEELKKHLREAHHKMIEAMEEFGGLRSRILYALNEGPKNGVEIMDSIQDMHGMRESLRGWPGHHGPGHRGGMDMREPVAWRPSPGSVYPMLNKMAVTGLINKKDDGRYELTPMGREAVARIFGQPGDSLERGPYSVENVLREMDGYASYLEDIKKEKLTPHADRLDAIIEKLAKVRGSLGTK